MKTVYFVRHGESEANTGAPVFQGETSPLTPKGLEQAKFIAQRCTKFPIDVILSSPAVRAHATAMEIMRATGKNIEVSELFTERKLPGELLDKRRNDPKAEEMYSRWLQSFHEDDTQIGDGDNFRLLKDRVKRVLDYLKDRSESNILVATHGFFLHMLVALVLLNGDVSMDEFKKITMALRMSNTGLTVIDHLTIDDDRRLDHICQEGWILRVWNDHAHLG